MDLQERADSVMEFLEGLGAGDHVHNVPTDFHCQLLQHHNPEPKLVDECILTQLTVPMPHQAPCMHIQQYHILPHEIRYDDLLMMMKWAYLVLPSKLGYGRGQAKNTGANHGGDIVEGRIPAFGLGECLIFSSIPSKILFKKKLNFLKRIVLYSLHKI